MKNATKRRRKKQQRKARRSRESGGRRNVVVADMHSSRPLKMSEVISHLAEPLVSQYGDSPEDLERIISLTVAAWNFTLLSAEEREQRSAKVVKDVLGDDPERTSLFHWLWDLVAERKRQFYPNLKHFIVDVHFTREENSVYFDVVYILAGSGLE